MKIKNIVWHWNEGHDLGLEGKELSLDEANDALWLVAKTAPKTGGYDKVKFTATFEDGDTYQGRFDVVHYSLPQETDTGALSFEGYIKNAVQFYIGERCPAHWTAEQYNEFLKSQNLAEEEKAAWMKRIYEK